MVNRVSYCRRLILSFYHQLGVAGLHVLDAVFHILIGNLKRGYFNFNAFQITQNNLGLDGYAGLKSKGLAALDLVDIKGWLCDGLDIELLDSLLISPGYDVFYSILVENLGSEAGFQQLTRNTSLAESRQGYLFYHL